MADKFYITTAITYTSQKPHIGNTCEVVITDTIARFRRMQGYDVFFLTGTDEHGQKIELNAQAAGSSPQEYVDKIAAEVRRIWDLVGASYNKFIRTTDSDHKAVVQKIFKKLYDQGDIYKGEYEGSYCVACESFFTSSQLVDGRCPDCGKEVQLAKEEAYFLKLSKYQDRLMKHMEENPDFIRPESRKREMVNNFLKPGLQDLCVSRTSFKWGIPVDFDDKHVIYVWIDALANYITALGYTPDGETGDNYKKYWPADLQVIGKDILRFHMIYWPIILMALGEPLPKAILGHPWMLVGTEKMSKSVGNVIYADDLVDAFGVDAVRYYVLSSLPYAQDGTITYQDMITSYNTDLANTLGNLVNRTVSMQNQYFEGVVQAPVGEEDLDRDLMSVCRQSVEDYVRQMEEYHLADAAHVIMNLARRCNKYIDETMPWSLAKDEAAKPRLGTVLYRLLEVIRHLGIMLQPFIPETAEKILNQIGAGADICTYAALSKYEEMVAGSKVGTAEPLFLRLNEKQKLEELEKAAAKAKKPAPPAKKEKPEGVAEIGIEDFAKVALCCAQVKECVQVPKSDKLYQLTLDDGEGGRQVVSGIAQWYSPEDLIGKKIALVKNLKPAKLRGVISQGMILAADVGDRANVIFLDDSVPCGAKIR